MKSNGILRFLLIFFLAGILGGGLFGFIFAMCIFGLIYSPESLILFSIIVSLFYVYSIYRQIKQKTYIVIIKKLFEVLFFSSLLNAMFLLEGEILEFNNFDMKVIYICVSFLIFIMTTFVIMDEYFQDSWLYKEINHIINGMQIYGLLPKEQKEENKK